MTVIAGLVNNGKAAIASDSQATGGDTPYNFGSKVIKANGFLVGLAGVAAILDSVKLKINEYKGKFETKADVNAFALWVAEVSADPTGFEFVIVTKKNSWYGVGTQLVLPGRNGIAACGSGGTHATTIMKHEFKKSDGNVKNPEELVRAAVAAAIEQSVSCGGDIYSEVL